MSEEDDHLKKPRAQRGGFWFVEILKGELLRRENPVWRYFPIAFKGDGSFIFMIMQNRSLSHSSKIGC